jgi:hypothetical protein
MTDKIQELADKIWAEEYWDNPATDKLLPAQLNRFAELIVRECMRMCDCADVSLLEHNRPQEASGASSVKQFIAEHFGVEE